MRKILLLFVPLLCLMGTVLAQKVVTGVVTNASDGETVIGAAVRVKSNPKIGAATDLDGKFKLTVPASAKTLIVTAVGMQDTEVPIRDGILKIKMKVDAKILDEVVVVGMTKVDKRLFTGASTKISGDKSKLDGMADASRALEGKAAGVSVQNVSGTFGSAPKIRVRGATSIYGDSKPLWVVDGVVMDDVVNLGPDDLASGDAATLISNAIAGLNPDDIESFQVLKDGSATSIYGARAMAGVIAITTKKGRAGISKISYTGEYTYRLIPSYRNFDIMNSQDQMSVYMEMERKGWLTNAGVSNAANSGIFGKLYEGVNNGTILNTPEARAEFLKAAEYRNTDWFQELFKNSIMNNHSVSVTSGTEKMSYYASLSAMVDPGWTIQSKVRRYTANLNTTYNITPEVSLNMIANAAIREQRAPGTLGQTQDVVNGALSRDFDINPFSYALNTSRVLDPNAFYQRNYAPFNIKHELANNYLEFNVYDLKYQAELKWRPIAGLELAVLGDVKYNHTKNTHAITEKSNQAQAYRAMQTTQIRNSNVYLYDNPDTPNAFPISVLSVGGFYNTRTYGLKAWDFRASAAYNKSFGSHITNFFGGMEVNAIDRMSDSFEGRGLQYDEGNSVFFDWQAFKKMKERGSTYFGYSTSHYRNVAFFANATYSYKGRYTLNGTIRYEGTNKMGKSRSARWLPTWNVSGSWNLGEESFFEPVRPAVSHLQLKASYSLTADKGPDWVNNSTTIIVASTPWRTPSQYQESGYRISDTENSELTYEKKHELNLGVDAGFLNDRLNLTFDWYKRNNYDLIAQIITQGLAGDVVKFGNVASMTSHGVELSLSSTNVKTKDFTWTTDFVYAHATNKVTDFYSQPILFRMVSGNGFAQVGYPVRSLFSVPFAGLNNKGLPTFYTDKEHQNTTVSGINFQQSTGLDFLKYEGSVDPTDFGSLGNTFRYKNWTLNVFFTYSFGNVLRLDQKYARGYSDLASMGRDFENRWINPGDESKTNIPVLASRRLSYETSNIGIAYNTYNFSDVRVAKGDFIRLKEISLAYNLPKEWAKKLYVNDISIKLQATNLFLLYSDKKLNGADPEFFNTGGVASPIPRQFTATLRIGI